jgi:hypothetical protein
MKDLLKEAIADAKAVRETALANAKLALEEAFTPRLQSMISAKLSEEMEEEEMEEMMPEGDEMPMPEPAEPEAEEMSDDSEEMSDDSEEEMNEEDDLDLDEIIRELEMAEELDSSEIGSGNNRVDDLEADTDNDDDLFAEGEEDMMDEDEDEEIDIQEIVRALREEDEDEEMMEGDHGSDEEHSSEDLEEAYNVIRFLKGKINEVNLLNAKLLYSNKLFRNFSLNENQKMKIIENFDRAYNLREVKLVYSTLAESFKSPSVTKRKIVKESFASKPVASTKPAKQVISEGADLAARFQKLAGLIKN